MNNKYLYCIGLKNFCLLLVFILFVFPSKAFANLINGFQYQKFGSENSQELECSIFDYESMSEHKSYAYHFIELDFMRKYVSEKSYDTPASNSLRRYIDVCPHYLSGTSISGVPIERWSIYYKNRLVALKFFLCDESLATHQKEINFKKVIGAFEARYGSYISTSNYLGGHRFKWTDKYGALIEGNSAYTGNIYNSNIFDVYLVSNKFDARKCYGEFWITSKETSIIRNDLNQILSNEL